MKYVPQTYGTGWLSKTFHINVYRIIHIHTFTLTHTNIQIYRDPLTDTVQHTNNHNREREGERGNKEREWERKNERDKHNKITAHHNEKQIWIKIFTVQGLLKSIPVERIFKCDLENQPRHGRVLPSMLLCTGSYLTQISGWSLRPLLALQGGLCLISQ